MQLAHAKLRGVPGPKRELLPVTENFLEQLKAVLEQFGTQARLARETGFSETAISRLASSDGPQRSRMVGPICRAMGWPVPSVSIRTPDSVLSAEWLQIIDELEQLDEVTQKRAQRTIRELISLVSEK